MGVAGASAPHTVCPGGRLSRPAHPSVLHPTTCWPSPGTAKWTQQHEANHPWERPPSREREEQNGTQERGAGHVQTCWALGTHAGSALRRGAEVWGGAPRVLPHRSHPPPTAPAPTPPPNPVCPRLPGLLFLTPHSATDQPCLFLALGSQPPAPSLSAGRLCTRLPLTWKHLKLVPAHPAGVHLCSTKGPWGLSV